MGKELTVLIVDDSMLARAMMKKAVSNYNPDWKIITANNAVEGLTAYHEHKPHIGIIDFNMPGMNGIELSEKLLDLDPEIQIALCTANIQKTIKDQSDKLKLSFIPKPVTEENSIAILSKFNKTVLELIQ